jgi:DUF2075 family protein
MEQSAFGGLHAFVRYMDKRVQSDADMENLAGAVEKKDNVRILSIHASKGLEFDYVGVIIGEDLRYEDGKVVTDFTKRAKTDQSLKGIKKLHKENPEKAQKTADEIIKNTYRTLMTRGMKGCYVYCVDENLSEYLKSSIGKEEES